MKISVPEPIVPDIVRLKPLHGTTNLVVGGQPRALIVQPEAGRYDAAAARIQKR